MLPKLKIGFGDHVIIAFQSFYFGMGGLYIATAGNGNIYWTTSSMMALTVLMCVMWYGQLVRIIYYREKIKRIEEVVPYEVPRDYGLR